MRPCAANQADLLCLPLQMLELRVFANPSDEDKARNGAVVSLLTAKASPNAMYAEVKTCCWKLADREV